MASQVSPGVIIKERDLSNAVVVGTSALRGAIASTFSKGPVGSIVNISSERELIDIFGTPVEANAADWIVASEFLRYGGTLAVVRATTGVENATKSGTGVLIADQAAFDAGVTSEKFAARDAGTDGNDLRVVIVDKVADVKMTKVGHGLAVGATLSDGSTTDHEVTVVIDNDTVGIKEGGGTAVSGNSFVKSAFTSSDWNALPIGDTGLTYKAIGARPGTSAYASERFLSADEVHVAVVDTSTNTIVADNNPTVYVTDSPSTPGGTYTTAKEIDVTSDPNGSNSNWSTTQDVFIDGNVGIGAAPNATYKLFIDGKIKTTGITELSDVRYKKEINTIESALDKIKQLRGVTYEWKNPTLENNRNGLQSGLIAQEVELVIPSVVDTDVDGFKSVQYSHLVPYLIESIKELNATIEQLQLTNANKEQKIGQLRSEINQSTLDNQEMKDMILQLYEKLDLEFDEDGKVISKGK